MPLGENRSASLAIPAARCRSLAAARPRIWREYAGELADDFTGLQLQQGYYPKNQRLLCVTGAGKPIEAQAAD